MRILFLHEVNYLEKPIFEMHEFPEHLAMRDHEVGFVHFPEGWSKQQIKKQGFKQQINGRVVEDSTLTLYTPQNAAGGFLGRLKTAFTFGPIFRRILLDFNPDVVVSFAVPTSGWQALRQSKKLGIPFVFRALDVSHKIRKSAFSGLIKSAEKFIYKNSDQVSANNPAMAEYCISLGAKASNTSVDLPPLDLSHFVNADSKRGEIRAKLGIPSDAKVIVYMGSFFYFSGLPDLIQNFAEASRENIYLVLIGGGEQDKELRDLVKDLSIQDRVLFTGFIGFAELPDYLGIADVAVNPMVPTLASNKALPNKVIQYLACGIPVVSTDLQGIRETFQGFSSLRTTHLGEEIWATVMVTLETTSHIPMVSSEELDKLSSMFAVSKSINSMTNLLENIRSS